jgi:hypothetical protein
LNSEGGDITEVKKQRDEAVQENIKLKKEMERMNYRINHLVKELNKYE